MARLEKLDEQIKKKDDEIEKARKNLKRKENQKKRLLSRQKEIERNQRAKRLIERGAILENVIGDATDFSNEQIQSLLFEVFAIEDARAKVEKMRAKPEEKAETGNPLSEQGRTYTPRRSKLHIPHPAASGRSRSFRCSSFSHKAHFVGALREP